MSKRKTIRVDLLREKVNTYLRNTDHNALHGSGEGGFTAEQWQMMRRGACTLLEQVLHDTGNYKGFGYVTPYTVDESSRHYH